MGDPIRISACRPLVAALAVLALASAQRIYPRDSSAHLHMCFYPVNIAEHLLSCYSMVFQDVVLFNTSVKDNIRIGRKGATDEEVLAVAKAAQCDEFAHRLPDGYDTVIGENGAKLSGGERQRISIARALLKNAPIVLLDEATASLDTECETHVQSAISRLIEGKTVIIVAHRMRTIEGADKIVVLGDGVAAEEGTGPELLKKDGIFARMKRLQSDSETWSL